MDFIIFMPVKQALIPILMLAGLTHATAGKTKTHVYIDGNNNRYETMAKGGWYTVQYISIKPNESSTGTYSGGEPWSISINAEEYKELIDLFNKAAKKNNEQTTERTMGCGTLVFPGKKKVIYLIKMNAGYMSAIEKKFKSLKEKYVPETTSIVMDTTAAMGTVVERNFVSKKGEVKGVTEFYFRPTQIKDGDLKDEYFIKLSKGKISRDEIKKYVDKEVTIKGSLLRGLWDADDNTHQSRFGDYVIIYEINQ